MNIQLDERDLFRDLRAELDAVPMRLDLAAVESRASGLARRRRVLTLTAATAAIAVLGGAGYAGTQILAPPSSTLPASGAVTLPGCTLDPGHCDPGVIAAWASRSGIDVEGASLQPVMVEADTVRGLPESGVVFHAPARPGRDYSVDLLITEDEGQAGLWDIRASEPDHAWEPERTVTIRPDVHARVDAFIRSDHGRYELWTIASTPAHGAIALAIEGRPPQGWRDQAALELLDRLLTAPPSDGPAVPVVARPAGG